MSTTTSGRLTVEGTVHFGRGGRGRKELKAGEAPAGTAPGRVPRVARLMALAIKFDRMIRDGTIADYAEIARLGHVTRARVSQIASLLHLAPDLQEALLFLPHIEKGRDTLVLRNLLPIAQVADWRTQRRMWTDLSGRTRAVGGA